MLLVRYTTSLLHSITVTRRGGYAATLAIAEINPKFEGKTVLLAHDQDGRPLRDGFKILHGRRHNFRSSLKSVHLSKDRRFQPCRCRPTEEVPTYDFWRLERFQEKWNPVFRPKARHSKNLERFGVSVKR